MKDRIFLKTVMKRVMPVRRGRGSSRNTWKNMLVKPRHKEAWKNVTDRKGEGDNNRSTFD